MNDSDKKMFKAIHDLMFESAKQEEIISKGEPVLNMMFTATTEGISLMPTGVALDSDAVLKAIAGLDLAAMFLMWQMEINVLGEFALKPDCDCPRCEYRRAINRYALSIVKEPAGNGHIVH